MCCGASCAARSATATSSASRSRSSTARRRARAEMGEAYPELHAQARAGRARAQEEEERFARDARDRHGRCSTSAIARLKGGKTHRRRDRLQALRHLRFPDRSHGRHRARARACPSTRRLRSRDGSAAQAVAGREQVRRRPARRRAHRRHAPSSSATKASTR